MQNLIAISLLVLALIYVLMRWMPHAWRQKILGKLAKRNPKLAQSWVMAEQHCKSSCSSACEACPSIKQVQKNVTKI